MRVLVTGAAGSLGPAIVRALVRSGHQVRACCRRMPRPGLFPPGVEICTGDVTDPDAARIWMRQVDGVLHLAALLHINHPPIELLPRYGEINTAGTENLVRAALREQVKRFVLFSTIAVYGSGNDGILTEESATEPNTPYGESKLAAEQIVLAARTDDGRPLGCVLRLGAVYGPTVKGNYRRLIQSLARGRFVPIGRGRNRRTLVHQEDVAQAARLALIHAPAAGRVYNVSDGGFHTVDEIISAICRALGRPHPRFSLPLPPVRLAVALSEWAARALRRQPLITRETIDKYTEDIAVSARRIQSELGFVPEYDLNRGWRETIREMRQDGALQ